MNTHRATGRADHPGEVTPSAGPVSDNLGPDLAELAHNPVQLRAALDGADAATLLLVLVQFTGDHDLLDRARPYISGPLNYHETMPDVLRSEIRDRLATVLIDYAQGRRPLPPIPAGDALRAMLSTAAGEDVAEDYTAMMREDLEPAGVDPRGMVWRAAPDPARLAQFPVAIIGGGMSGLCAAIRLKQAGLPFVILEKNQAVGGSWYENFYPGCGVDTPNHFYSYSFFLNHDWSHFFAKRDELWAYFEQAADRFGIRDHIRFGTEVVSAVWSDSDSDWLLTLASADGTHEQIRAKAVISAVGVLNRPKLPDIPGRESFAGPALHTAAWNNDFDWRGKRVGLIGTGASGQQVGPTIAPDVAQLTIFQRSPHWVVPNPNYFAEVSDGMKWALAHIPYFARWYRFQLFWAFADGLHATLKVDPAWDDGGLSINAKNARHREFMVRYLRSKLGEGSPLIDKVTPGYPPYGKRILIDNNWFEMLQRDNVDLETGRIARIVPDGIEMADGQHIALDALIYATGFQASKVLAPMTITGVGGKDLHAFWGPDDAAAYLGTMVPGFPNFFMLMGPNTGLAHGGNVIFITECQVRYILGALRQVIEQGAQSVDVKPAVFADHIAEVDRLHAGMVWTHKGLTNWYRNDHGRVFALLPYRLVEYWQMTRTFAPEDYTIT
ncbi:NAD(P)/FAD-dependent oxidoreductase [Novosphingobium sp.]|uniref:flavin-containing monooxygenase n=1 Tax=Novosphingobium sp. TaxID=1874826 RepID=UPI003341323F